LGALAAGESAPDDVHVAGLDGLRLAERVERAGPGAGARDVRRDPGLVEELARGAAIHEDGALVLDRVPAGPAAAVLLLVRVEEARDEDGTVVAPAVERDPAVVEDSARPGPDRRVRRGGIRLERRGRLGAVLGIARQQVALPGQAAVERLEDS